MDIGIRTAHAADIPAMHEIRLAVRENALRDLSKVTPESYLPFVEANTIWVAENAAQTIGFAAIDAAAASVWALFVSPEWEGRGAGTALHNAMLNWARGWRLTDLRLTTASNTRAARFYTRSGWCMTGGTSDGQSCFSFKLRGTDS